MYLRKVIRLPWQMIGTVLFAFLLTRLVVFTITYLSLVELPVKAGDIYWRAIPNNILEDGLVRWDSGFYLDITIGGYNYGAGIRNTPFFPLYPMMIWLLTRMTDQVFISGLIISNLAFFISLFYLYALVNQEYNDHNTASRAVFYLASAPSAFFFSTLYSESIFLLFMIACIYYTRNRHWGLAALTGALASATRIPGITLAIYIFLEGIYQAGIRLGLLPINLFNLREKLKLIFLKIISCWYSNMAAIGSTAGLLVYMIFLKNTFGNPLAFITQESNWNRSLTLFSIIRIGTDTIKNLHLNGNILAGQINANPLQDVVATLVFIPLVIAVIVKMRFSYGIFTLAMLLIPLATGSLLSMRRFVLMLIPCFIVLAIWGRRPWVDRLIMGLSLPLQAYMTILFTHWYFAG